LVGFGVAAAAGIFDFFAVLFTYHSYNFVFEIDKFNLRLQRFLWASHHTFTASIAMIRVHYYIEFARTITVAVMRNQT